MLDSRLAVDLPALAPAIAAGDDAALDRMERLAVIHQARRQQGPADPTARAEAILERLRRKTAEGTGGR